MTAEDIVYTTRGKVYKNKGGMTPHVPSPRILMLVPLAFKNEIDARAKEAKMFSTDYLDNVKIEVVKCQH